MSLESKNNSEEFPDELPIDYEFPEEYIRPEKPIPSEQEDAQSANKAMFYDVDGVLVVELFSSDGTFSVKYGLKDGKFVLDYPGEEEFYNEGAIIRKATFQRLLEDKKSAA